jgi:hypothetical protein
VHGEGRVDGHDAGIDDQKVCLLLRGECGGEEKKERQKKGREEKEPESAASRPLTPALSRGERVRIPETSR